MISKREKVEKEREKGTIGKRYGTGTEELGDEAQRVRRRMRKNREEGTGISRGWKNREDETGARPKKYGAQKQPFDSAMKNLL